MGYLPSVPDTVIHFRSDFMTRLSNLGSSRLFVLPWTVVFLLLSFMFLAACDSGGANQNSSSDDSGGNDLTSTLGSSVSVRLEENNGTKTGKQAKGDILVSFFYDDGSECEATLSIDDALPIESTVKPEGCSSSSTRSGIRISFLPAPGSSADGLSLKVLKEDGTVLQSAQTASDGTLVSEGGTIPSSARTPKWVGNWDLVTSDGVADDQRNYDIQYVLTETEWTQVIIFDDGRCGITRFSLDALQTYSDGSTVTQGTLQEVDGLLYDENQIGADGSSELTIVNGSLRYEVKVDPNYQGNVSVAAPATQSVETDLSARTDCSS